MTMHDNPRLVREFLGRGASGYLVESASLQELLTARPASAGPHFPAMCCRAFKSLT